MADNVIIGTGKPRFVIPTENILPANTVSSSTTTTVVLASAVDLTQLDETYGLRGIGVWSLNSSSEDTWGVCQSFNDTSETLTVISWSNGNPNTGATVLLQGRYIDLPYCQRLTESFSPDFIVKKMIDGSIKRIKRGFYYRATLDYARYFHKDEMEIIRYLYDENVDYAVFYPRVDNTAVHFSVDIDSESEISFYQLQSHQGHGGIVINMRGIDRLPRIPFNDPTVLVANAVSDDNDLYVTDDVGEFPTAD